MGDDEGLTEKRKSAYSSRLSRARAFNSEKRGGGALSRGDSASFGTPLKAEADSMANMAFSVPVQDEVDVIASNANTGMLSNSQTPAQTAAHVEENKASQIFMKPEGGVSVAFWDWNAKVEMMALVRSRLRLNRPATALALRHCTRLHARFPSLKFPLS